MTVGSDPKEVTLFYCKKILKAFDCEQCNTSLTMKTRSYPQGIQQLVSTYELPELRGGGWFRPTQPKSQDLSKSAFSGVVVGGGGRGGGVVVQNNSTQSAMICPNLHGGGGGVVVQTNIPEILEWGHSRNFEPKILATEMCSAPQIVSHILRMWRLIK